MDGESTRIDGACRDFEAELIAGRNPRIEQYLSEVPAGDRTALVQELLTIEIEFRCQRGESPRPEDFNSRFPEHIESIADIINFSATPLPTAGPRQNLSGTADGWKGDTRISDSDRGGESTSSLAGSRFGDYELLEEIARGGMGVVYKARQTSLNRIVALKMILSGKLASERDIQRFYAEAEAAAGLDHANIVPVYEVGRHDGHHFFSMGFVEGESLQDKIADGPLPPREAARLVKSIAEAVQFAHDRGVVHRDLKPANVLLSPVGGPSPATEKLVVNELKITGDNATEPELRRTTDNEQSTTPKITDFGLAKLIEGDTSLTATGQIMGTPSYMPPEQAAGRTDEIGPAADIYSMGALLYCLITGRPPFQAANLAETLKQVLERDPVPPGQLNSAVEKDLETICLKCLAKDSVKRYASAAALAEDLSRYLDGRPIIARPVGFVEKTWRWCRRNPIAAALVALLMTLSVGGPIVAYRQTILSGEARRERKRANEKVVELDESNRSLNIALAAETRAKLESNENERRASRNLDRSAEVVKQFVFEIGKEGGPLTETPGGKPLRLQLLQKARTFYEQLIADNPGAQLTPLLAETHFDLAFVLAQLSGNKERAIAEYQRAIQVCRILTTEDPRGTKFENLLAASHIHLGTLYQETERPAEALRAYKAALSLYEQLLKENPHAAEFRKGLAECHNNIALLSDHTSKAAESMSSLKKAQEIYEALIREHPNNPAFQSGLAGSYLNQGVFIHNTGRLDHALAALKKSSAIFGRLAEQFPNSIEYQQHFEDALVNIGGVYRRTGRLDEALATWRKALVIRRKIAQENPTVTKHQTALVKCLNNIGLASWESGDLAGALAAYKSAIQVQTQLVQENPTVTTYLSTLASCHNNLGMLYDQPGKTDEAIKAFQQGLKIYLKLTREHPDVPDFQHGLAMTRHGIGLAFREAGYTKLVLSNFQQELHIYERLTSKHPKVTIYQRGLAASVTDIGDALLADGKTADALKSYRRAIPLWQQLVRDHPDTPEYLNGLANCQSNLGVGYKTAGKSKEALEVTHQAVAIWENLGRQHPNNIEYLRGLARGCGNLGKLQSDAGQLLPAIASWQQALTAEERLAHQFPNLTKYQSNLANRQGQIGTLQYAAGRMEQALSAFQQALETRQRIAKRNPSVLDHQFNVARSQIGLGNFYRYTGRDVESALHLHRAIRILAQLCKRDSTNTSYRSECRKAHMLHGATLRRLARHGEAVEAWREALALASGPLRSYIQSELCRSLADNGEHVEATTLAIRLVKNSRNGTQIYNLACATVACIESALCDSKLDSGQRKLLATRYAETAIEILAALGRAGFFKTEKNQSLLRSDADLDAIRHRDDFRKLAHSVGVELPASARRPRSTSLPSRQRPLIARRPLAAQRP